MQPSCVETKAKHLKFAVWENQLKNEYDHTTKKNITWK